MKSLITLLMVVAGGGYACFADGPLRLALADCGRTNALAAGARIEIALDGNPTTGYEWTIAAFSAGVLRLVGEPRYVESASPGGRPMVGAGGTYVFRFEASAPGTGRVDLVYRRPWETTACDRVYSTVIEVK